jgi:CRP-like cAMP-binding protein
MGDEVLLLDADRELAHMLSESEAAAARPSVRVATARLARGPWEASREYGDSRWLGLLVLEGFLARETRCGEDAALELVGPGDLLRPWDHDGDYTLPMIETAWKVLEPTQLALLDERCVQAVARWPALAVAILSRTGRRTRWFAGGLAISAHPRIAVRIAELFRQLAQRWGRQHGEVVLVPLRLTHEEISQLIGANRPSVTVALGELREAGQVLPLHGGGWSVSARVMARQSGLRGSAPDLRAGTTASDRRPSVSAASNRPKSRSAMS